MRNNNPDIYIHHLIAKADNKAKSNYHKYDYSEELILKVKKKKKISIIQENEKNIEERGHWKRILWDHLIFTILIKEGQDEQTVVNHFIEKLKTRI